MCSILQVVTFIALTGSISGNLERALERAGGSGWNYAGQAMYWPETHPFCGGKRQSPIDFDTSQVFDVPSTVKPVDFSAYKKDGIVAGKLSNTGSSLKFTPDSMEAADLPGIRGGELKGSYELLQFHFHWGSSNDRGSEHTINGHSYPMELHLVHIKKNYLKNVAAALSNPDGLAVVGIMFVVGKNGSNFEAFQPIVDAANAIHEDQTLQVPANISLNKFLREVGPGYYTYDGSLTTPTCNEVVSWHMMQGTIAISQEQLDAFKGLNYPDDSPMVDNFRPPQPLNNRVVKRWMPMKQKVSGKPPSY